MGFKTNPRRTMLRPKVLKQASRYILNKLMKSAVPNYNKGFTVFNFLSCVGFSYFTPIYARRVSCPTPMAHTLRRDSPSNVRQVHTTVTAPPLPPQAGALGQ